MLDAAVVVDLPANTNKLGFTHQKRTFTMRGSAHQSMPAAFISSMKSLIVSVVTMSSCSAFSIKTLHPLVGASVQPSTLTVSSKSGSLNAFRGLDWSSP